MKVLVVSPHRDDAAFSLGLSIEHWLRSGHRVQILNCFTQSASAPYSDVEMLHSNDRVSFVSALRKREDMVWNKLLGGTLEFIDLDLLDAPLRLACPLEEVCTVAIRPGDRAVSRLTGAVAKRARIDGAGDVAVLLPLALGNHIDHRVALQAGIEALAAASLPIAFYEDLPYASYEGIEAAARATGLALEPAYSELASDDPSRQLQRKRRMLECYDSQIDSAVAQQIATFSEQYRGRERVWANSGWLTSALQPIRL